MDPLEKDEKLTLFKNVVIDLIENRNKRPLTKHIPDEIDTSMSNLMFVSLFQSDLPAKDRFIITRFVLYMEEKKIVIEYENTTKNSGAGAVIGYDFDPITLKVTYRRLFNAFLI
jgi:hypothetical protein